VTLFTALLLLGGGYLGARWLAARAENARLLDEIAVLKRRLATRRAA
jgi:hypothetical protein